MTRTIEADELRIESPYAEQGIWSTSPIVASAPEMQPEYLTALRHRYLSNAGTDSLVISLNGYPLAQRAVVTGTSFDLNGNGKVDVFDFSAFTTDYTSPPKPYNARSDFNGDGAVNVYDFAAYTLHTEHEKPFSPGSSSDTSTSRSSPMSRWRRRKATLLS